MQFRVLSFLMLLAVLVAASPVPQLQLKEDGDSIISAGLDVIGAAMASTADIANGTADDADEALSHVLQTAGTNPVPYIGQGGPFGDPE